MRTIFAFALLAPLALSGCGATFSAGGAAAPGLVGQGASDLTSTLDSIDSAVDQEVLNRATRIHNLQVGLGQINGASGMVTTVPMIVTPAAPVSVPAVPVKPVPAPKPIPAPKPAPVPVTPPPPPPVTPPANLP